MEKKPKFPRKHREKKGDLKCLYCHRQFNHSLNQACGTITVSLKGASGGYFPMDVYQQMKVLCAEQGLTTQGVLANGINAVFRTYDKPPIA